MTIFNEDLLIVASRCIYMERDFTVLISNIDEYINTLGEMNENVGGYIDDVMNEIKLSGERYDDSGNVSLFILGLLGMYINTVYYAIAIDYHVEDATEVVEILEEIERIVRRFSVSDEGLFLYRDNVVSFNKKEPENN